MTRRQGAAVAERVENLLGAAVRARAEGDGRRYWRLLVRARALARRALPTAPRRVGSRLLVSLGDSYKIDGLVEDAAPYHRRAARLDPTNGEAWYEVAGDLQLANRPCSMLLALGRSVRHLPKWPYLHDEIRYLLTWVADDPAVAAVPHRRRYAERLLNLLASRQRG